MLRLVVEDSAVVTKLIDVATEFVVDAVGVVEVDDFLDVLLQELFRGVIGFSWLIGSRHWKNEPTL
jgi:hypothetical protein